jgi:hypothetical protein
MVVKEDLLKLTNIQLKEIVQQVKEKLNLNVSQAKKEVIVDTLMNLHKGNKFFGKKLLSLDDSGHIKIPKRQQGFRTEKQKKFQEKKKERMELKKLIEKEAAKKLYNKTDKARLDRIEKKIQDLKDDDPKFQTKMNIYSAQLRGVIRREKKRIQDKEDLAEIKKGGIPKTFRKPPNF